MEQVQSFVPGRARRAAVIRRGTALPGTDATAHAAESIPASPVWWATARGELARGRLVPAAPGARAASRLPHVGGSGS